METEAQAAETVPTATGSEVSETQVLEPEADALPGAIRLFFEPAGTLRLTVADARTYHAVKLYQAAPLSRPGRYLSLQSGKGEEILMVDRIEDLESESRAVAEEELKRRYLTARVRVIRDIRTEFGVTYWDVETDRGGREFVVQSLSESSAWLSEDHLLLSDVDGNRFEIASRAGLDPGSRARLDSVL